MLYLDNCQVQAQVCPQGLRYRLYLSRSYELLEKDLLAARKNLRNAKFPPVNLIIVSCALSLLVMRDDLRTVAAHPLPSYLRSIFLMVSTMNAATH